MLHFIVSDTGIGIASDKVDVIFESFRQSDNTITRKYGGTGLGLSISQRIVELHGGSIWVESELGKGSKFHFTMCYNEQTEEQRLRWVAENVKESKIAERPEMVHVLVAEDHPVNQKMITHMLDRNGYMVTIAQNGQEAVDYYLKGGFDVILMDVSMPVMDGVEAASRIREIEKETGKHIAIIAVTANAIKGDREKYLQAGMDDYLPKPIRRDALFQLIDKYAMQNEVGFIETSRILVAEDYIPDQTSVLTILAKENYKVDLVENGLKALQLLETNIYDLVLMDSEMPLLDGLGAIKQIRMQDQTIPVIGLIYQPNPQALKKFQDSGMNDYCEKPLDEEILLAKIKTWLLPNKLLMPDAPSEAMKLEKMSVPANEAEPVIDYARAIEEFDGDKDFLNELLKEFLQITTGKVEILAQGLEKNDIQSVKENAHAVKGGASNLTAMPLSRVAAALENLAKSGNLETGTDLLEDLKLRLEELSQFSKELK